MRLDLKRFRHDLAAERNEQVAKTNHGARQLTGAMATIRNFLPEINRKRALHFTWSQIASGLAAQGVMQIKAGNRIPISGRRVSALVDSIRRQDNRRQHADELRAMRSDRPHEPTPEVAMPNEQILKNRPLRLSADLNAGVMPAALDPNSVITELTLRRTALEGIQGLLKKEIT
jgi:hypothetical protein